MNTRIHPASMVTGVVFAMVGLLFFLEALEVWTFQMAHLVYVGPAVLIALGGVLLVAAVRRR